MSIKGIELHPGHWKNTGSGANGLINEVTEARKVTKRVYEILQAHKVPATYFEDNTSSNQQQNLNALVKHHNADRDDLVVSIHFNAVAGIKESDIGTEVLYYSQKALATKLAAAISAASGLKNRGAKKRDGLAVLTKIFEPAVLIEVCFVNSRADVKKYQEHFEKICLAIAETLGAHIGLTLKKPVAASNKTVVAKEGNILVLNGVGRKEAQDLIRRACKEGVFDASYHTEERIAGYTDSELVSYQIAYVNRTVKA
ncbi:hypothetical protein BTO30_16700 [Domibacillus antri]|uniref:MurNAc-LAA domain-containing protein n=1 Tax=Domibacillus antri TaxID=1714264 RepID=A0A1Q8Q1A1_9BACI|nr:N-acetylmuramoyl-L-alanine amidase [Domibacillus antri]OLN21116.1 hypothetical protein BTO30_16700 [Domibacillus antri]